MADLSQYDSVFQAAGQEWNVDPTLLKAMATQESGGKTNAVSPKGAQGLMQITPDTQKYLGVTDPNDPVQSIYGAAKYMNEALDKEGTPEGALLYYHGGPGWRQAYGPESRAYVPAVTAHYVALKPQQTDQPPAQAAPSPSTPAPTPQGPLILGDSLASKGGLGGTGVVGASPKAVLDSIAGLPDDQVKGRDVVLSGGASNNPAQASLVYDQVQALKAKGANSVTVVGVGDRPDFQGVNDQLAIVSGRSGAKFVPLDTTQLGPDRVHPTQQGYKTLLAAATPKTATDATPAPTPAPAGSQSQGKPMASDDLPSWLPPAPKAGGGNGTSTAPAATGTTSDGLPSWLPPAPKPSTAAVTTQQEQQPGETTARGVMRNVAAGVLEGSGGTINVLRDPVGNLILRPLTTAGAAAYDWLAPHLGLPEMTPEQRADLTGDTEYQQPGTRMANALGASDVVPQSEAERIVRAGTAGATSALQLAPGVIAPLVVGGAGGVGGQVAADYAPDWTKPYAQLGGMLVGGGAGALSVAGLARGGPAAYNALQRYAAGAPEHPLAPQPPIQAPAPAPAPTQPSAPAGPVTLGQVTGAVVRATPESWRPVAPGEEYVPGREYRMNQATGQREVNEGGPAASGGGVQPSAGPQPAGAQATPTGAAQMTPEEIATQRTVADKQWLNQTQQPGVRDTTEHIPGITANLVEQEQTVTRARELKALKNLNPELSQTEREILDHNTNLRKGFYADTVGSDVTRAADLKAANEKIEADLKQVWRGKGEADSTPVQAAIKTELAGSAGDLPPMKSAMKQVSDSLENAGTDPEAMYRTHRLINYLQSRQGQLENPGYGAADVQAALTRVKRTLAQTIDDAASGFGKAMSDYSAAKGPIDAAKALQDRENGLYDSRGHMSFLKVHALMRDIIEAQKWDAPNDPLAGVSDAQMTRLKALHDDLKRTASAKDLAAAQGSDTVMNAVDVAKEYGKLAGRVGVEGAANLAFGPGVGSMIVRGAENLLRPISSGIAARRQIRRGMEILRPPPNNPLNPPAP